MKIYPATASEPYRIHLLLPQFLTESIMRERLLELGSLPQFSRELRSFEHNEEGVIAQVLNPDGEETIRARYLVGADGGHSFVRRALDIGFPGSALGRRSIVADVEIDGLSRSFWHRWNEADKDRLVSLCPFPGTNLFQMHGPIPLESDVDLTAEGLSAFLAERTSRRDIIVRSVSWASTFNMSQRLADRFRVGRVFIIGDAAHVHPPTGGQGLNTSVQDGYNLGWKLASVIKYGASEDLLDTYEMERRPVAANMIHLSTKLLEEAKRGEFRRGKEVQQLDVGYPTSSLTLTLKSSRRSCGRSTEEKQELEGVVRVVAGDRAPDAPLRGAAGQLIRLFNLFQGPHWTLLGFEVKKEESKTVQSRPGLRIHHIGRDIEDYEGYFRLGYGVVEGDWVLVRPDGYIAAIVGDDGLPLLETYLDKVGLTVRR